MLGYDDREQELNEVVYEATSAALDVLRISEHDLTILENNEVRRLYTSRVKVSSTNAQYWLYPEYQMLHLQGLSYEPFTAGHSSEFHRCRSRSRIVPNQYPYASTRSTNIT